MIIIGNEEIERFVFNNKELFALIHNNRLIWGNWILIVPDSLLFNWVNEEKIYNVSCVGEWVVEDLFASDAGR